MTLDGLGQGEKSLPVEHIGADKPLAHEIQSRLAALGLLDPPDDGLFGPVSLWALGEFLKRMQLATNVLTPLGARTLAGAATELLPIRLVPGALASEVVAAMQAKRHWLCRHPDTVNIVYIEGMDPNGQPNNNPPNRFNDLRMLLRIGGDGRPEITQMWDGTSEPGRHYTEVELLNPAGVARIALGQYKAWSVGMHNGSTPHEALVQTMDITICRDKNKDYRRDNDARFKGMFGINQHWGYDMAPGNIGNASAGCLLGRTKVGHREFMALCKSDPRYEVNKSYRFMTAVLEARDIMEVRDAPPQ